MNGDVEPQRPVRYLAYGSNVSAARLDAYINGAGPESPYGPHVGARERHTVRAIGGAWYRGRLRFVGSSRRWGGGVCTVDVAVEGERFFGVEYEMTRSQFEDLVRQENGDRTIELDWDQLQATASQHVGTGLYGLVCRPSGSDAFLVTAAQPRPTNTPSDAYLRTIRSGLADWLAPEEVERYLDAVLDRMMASDSAGQAEVAHDPNSMSVSTAAAKPATGSTHRNVPRRPK